MTIVDVDSFKILLLRYCHSKTRVFLDDNRYYRVKYQFINVFFLVNTNNNIMIKYSKLRILKRKKTQNIITFINVF